MPVSIRPVSFFLSFLFSWLLLLLLGESYLSYLLLGGISLLLILFAQELGWQEVGKYKWLVGLWVAFLISLFTSLVFSTSLPLSLHTASRYTFVFLSFWFFLLIKKSFLSSVRVVKSLLLIGLVILIVSVIFQFFPSLASLLPGMNLLHATYGHNHLAALLLLLIPLSWWLASEYIRAGQSHWWWLLPVGFTLGLLTSFGRVAVVIGLVQFIFIWRQLKKSHFASKYQLSLVLKTLVSLFLVVLVGKMFFSAVTLINPDFTCPVPSLEKQLCKSIVTESRPRYWRWAVETIKNHPLFGAGPGTFGMAAKKYHLAPYGSSAYAHNAYLQNLADLGLVGGSLFIILMLSLLYLAGKNADRKWSWQSATLLGVGAIYADVLFDFDWDFISVLGITVIFLALLIKDKTQTSQQTRESLPQLFKTLYTSLAIIVISIAGLYLYTDYLTRVDRVKQAFDFFPYFHWHQKIYETNPDIDKQKLAQIYINHPDTYSARILETKDQAQKQHLKEQWFRLDPWSASTRDLISYYLDIQDWDGADHWLQEVSELYSLSTKSGYTINYPQQLKLTEQGFVLAQGYLKSGNYQRAFEWLQLISTQVLSWEQKEQLSELLITVGNDLATRDIQKTVAAYDLAKENISWSLNNRELWFEQHDVMELRVAEIIKYLQLTATWQGEEIGYKDEAQHLLAQKAVERFLAAGEWENLEKVIMTINWSQHDYEWRLELVKNLTKEIDLLAEQKKYESSLALLKTFQSLLPGEYWPMVQPGNLLVTAGRQQPAAELFKKCLVEFEEVSGERHDDCFYGLEALENGQPRPERYLQVSQIIRGEAVWQDFVK